jgi:hypothetical protein
MKRFLNRGQLFRNNLWRAEAEESPARVAKQIELSDAWNTASHDLSRIVVIASLACGAEVRTALADFVMLTSDLSVEFIGGHPEAFIARSGDLATKYNAITKPMRKETGNNAEPMFLTDVSQGAQAPAKPGQSRRSSRGGRR